MEEKPRGIDPFLFQDDSRGGYVIRKQNSNQPETEADYILLDIFLKDIENLGNRKLYVIGDFNQYRMKENYRLFYDSNEKAYRGLIKVKQGYLEYVIAEPSYEFGENMNWDLSWTEGNHWQCPNYYDAIIYMKEWGKRYDRAIANKKFYTNGNLGLSLD